MKRLFALLSASLLAFATTTVHADDHAAPANIVGFVYNFNVSNPAGVVEALTEYWNSPTGKKILLRPSCASTLATAMIPAPTPSPWFTPRWPKSTRPML